MCGFGILVPALPWRLIGFVRLCNLVWMVVQDLVKLAVYRELAAQAAHARPVLARLTMPLHGLQSRVAAGR